MKTYDNNAFLALGTAAAIVIGMAALMFSVWALFRISQITDQVEQAADAATPTMAETFAKAAPAEPLTDEFSKVGAPVQYKVINGVRIRVKVEEPRADQPEAEVVQVMPRSGPIGEAGVEKIGSVPRPPLPKLSQHPKEAGPSVQPRAAYDDDVWSDD